MYGHISQMDSPDLLTQNETLHKKPLERTIKPPAKSSLSYANRQRSFLLALPEALSSLPQEKPPILREE